MADLIKFIKTANKLAKIIIKNIIIILLSLIIIKFYLKNVIIFIN